MEVALYPEYTYNLILHTVKQHNNKKKHKSRLFLMVTIVSRFKAIKIPENMETCNVKFDLHSC